MPGPGIIKLYTAVIVAMDDDDDFSGSVYGGATIVRAVANLAEDYENDKTPVHPNLLRAMVQLKYLRVRIGAGDPHFQDFFLAVLDKLRNKPQIQQLFKDRIKAIDNPRDPAIDGITSEKPWLGVQSRFNSPDPKTSHQREEELVLNAWIYHQRYPRNTEQNVVGE